MNIPIRLAMLVAASVCVIAAKASPADGETIRLTVVDSDDKGGLPAASVFNHAGIMLGITDDDGSFSRLSPSDYPLTVRYLGYESAKVSVPTDTIMMTPQATPLSEVEVTRQIDGVRVLCYIREYSSAIAGDTVSQYNEYMADYLLPMNKKAKGLKTWNSPRVLLRRSVSRFARRDGTDSVSSGASNLFLSWVEITNIDKEGFTEPESLRGKQSGNDTLTEHKTFTIYRKTPVLLSKTRDYLSDKKEHVWSPWYFKMLGFTMDVDILWESSVFPVKESGEYNSFNFSTWSFSMGVWGRGKWFKKVFHTNDPIRINSHIEIYPVEYEFVSAQESKDLKKDRPESDMIIPETAPRLDPSTLDLIARCTALDPTPSSPDPLQSDLSSPDSSPSSPDQE